MRYRTFPTTADMGVVIYGADERELFENAAYAFRRIVAGDRCIKPKERRKVELEFSGYEMGLFMWMSELLYLYDSSLFLPARVHIKQLSEEGLKATLEGERKEFKPKVYIKAVTMHNLKIEKGKKGLKARMILDL